MLDEVGRGTSTIDGLSIATAVAEHLSNCKIPTLFATHFHELNNLENLYNNIHNYHLSVSKLSDDSGIIFNHKVKKGGINQSFGIEVAKLAGIP